MKKALYAVACLGIVTTALLGFAYWHTPPRVTSSQADSDHPMQWNRMRHGETTFTVEVAHTPAQHQQGLMDRETLADNHGMLFVFDKPEVRCFWMKDTPLPLSVAFLAESGEVLHIAQMTPYSRAAHCSPVPVSLALEMPQGWFAQHGITAGSLLQR